MSTRKLLLLAAMCTRAAAAVFLVFGSVVTAVFLAAPAHALPPRRTAGVACLPEERDALLAFKDGISGDPGGRFDSWRRGGGGGGREGDRDCCRWRGVRCSNRTGRVLALRLRNEAAGAELDGAGRYAGAPLVGGISPALLSLPRLRHLDLSRNYLEGAPPGGPPAFLGGLKDLRYLNLSGIFFSGEVPPQIGNLSRLRWLDHSSDFDPRLMRSSDLSWLARLPLLRHLSLSSVDLSRARDWPRAVSLLPALNTLHLSSCSLPSSHQWRLPPSFRNLTNLVELDLSMNYFHDPASLSWFWNITSLRHLNLMATHLSGQLPDALDDMASLEVLDYSYNGNMATMPRSLTKLCNLRALDLDSSLAGGDIVELLETLPTRCSSNRLEELYLASNGITGTLPDYSKLMHLTSLRILELSYNNLTGSIPLSMWNLTDLDTLDLSFNDLTGLVPARRGYFAGLSTLILSRNSYLAGNIPADIRYLTSLTTLDLYGNYLTGSVPSEIGTLTNLTYLDLSDNDLDGVITEEHFASLLSLTTVDLSLNRLKIEVDSEWRPLFRLEEAIFELCLMGPFFPQWLQWQVALSYLDISSTGIADKLPDWFSTTFSKAATLEMSNNTIYGRLPADMEIMSLQALYINSNQLTGHIPKLPRNITVLDISNNSLSGTLPLDIGAPKLQVLIMFSNRINGRIPESICELHNLAILDLANNLFIGELPTCSAMKAMRYLLLRNNSFSGKFPPYVQNCTSLGFLDLAWNNFSGTLPVWTGELVQLQFLRLSYNMFTGNIPIPITKLKLLHHLNLANNNISRSIPRGLSNLTAMTKMAGVGSFPYQGYASVTGEAGSSLSVVTKGQELTYGVGILEMVSIDLSLNGLTGVIPEEIASLDALVNLNLSWNHLSSKIPDNIGALRSLESLDLSKNMLLGEIPSSLSNMTYLSFLDFSDNNLTGRVPSGSQLDTLYEEHPYMYSGNNDLCGPPLQKNCSGNDASKDGDEKRTERGFISMSLYFGLGLGFILGLWVVFCILLFKKTWRIVYFCFLDRLYDQTYVCGCYLEQIIQRGPILAFEQEL